MELNALPLPTLPIEIIVEIAKLKWWAWGRLWEASRALNAALRATKFDPRGAFLHTVKLAYINLTLRKLTDDYTRSYRGAPYNTLVRTYESIRTDNMISKWVYQIERFDRTHMRIHYAPGRVIQKVERYRYAFGNIFRDESMYTPINDNQKNDSKMCYKISTISYKNDVPISSFTVVDDAAEYYALIM